MNSICEPLSQKHLAEYERSQSTARTKAAVALSVTVAATYYHV